MSQQLELLQENPSQWTAVTYITPEIQKKEIKPFVILALKELEGLPDSRTRSLLHADKFAAVRAAVRHAARVRSAVAGGWDSGELAAFLEGLKFNSECVSELIALLCSDGLYDRIPTHLRVKPGLVSLQWKIDISLSQANLSSEQPSAERAREIVQRDTHIILSLSLSDGATRTHRLSVTKFHELRFVVASALKRMIVLERSRALRD